MWFLRNTRGATARQHTIDALASDRRAAGFDVQIEVDNGTAEQREAAYVAARSHRAESLAGRSEHLAERARTEHAQSNAIVEHIPLGQPVLVGHHSQRRHERDLDRSRAAMTRSVQASNASQAAAHVARSAQADVARREDPAFIGRRIADREREIRELQRNLDSSQDNTKPQVLAWREGLTARLAQARDELALWQRKLEETGARIYTREDIKAGDYVRIRHGWCEVARANPKTVSCHVGMPRPLTYAYTEIKDHRPKQSAAT
ncbi:DUF3560 domain-containing protein [Solirubrobacter pauli]|uniref:DUF3560 domain-containing protein n=1 Tax=Solirubrobacter pauli TaxID=166793 RepID=UPI0014769EF4|nr:DUF3560 domain-containing protein [Solirubrobacter pauli]